MTASDRFAPRTVYLYVVCLVALVIAIFAAVNLVSSLVELAYPDPGLAYYSVPTKDGEVDPAEQARLAQLAAESARRQAVLGVVSSATMLAIAVPVYLYHWRRVQRERPVPPPAP